MSTLEQVREKFTDQLQTVDDVAQIVLKGHLVMEEVMTESIQTFLLHKELVEDSRLQFYQKLQLCRAMSVADQKNKMWDLVASINSLRNHLSHSLKLEERSKRIEALNSNFAREFPDPLPKSLDGMSREAAVCMLAIGGAIGFLHAHLEEVRRFKARVLEMDELLNDGKLSKK